MSSPVWSWLRNLIRRREIDVALDAEVRGYLELLVDEKVAGGMSVKEARRMAKVELGGETQVKQAVRDGRAGSWLESLMQDLRFAFRTLRRDRSFTLIAVLILGLGIGANVAVFSVVNTMLLRPLPFQDAGRLTWIEPGKNLDQKLLAAAGLGGRTFVVDDFEEFQKHNQSFASVTAYNPFLGNSEYTLTGGGQAQGVPGVMVAGNFFEVLGVRPLLGRLFVQEELQKNGSPAVLLSNGFWRRQFHANPGVVGQTIVLNKKPVTVVGVMPASFDFGAVFAPGLRFDVYTPAVMDEMRSWGNTLSVVGRLKPGVTLKQAQAESDTLFAGITEERYKSGAYGEMRVDFSPTLTGLKEHVSGKLRRSMIALWSAVGMVMLIVCVNLSSLLMARATARSKEFAMRVALGARRGRLLRQLLTESLVLAMAGAALGLGLAYAITNYVAHQEQLALPLLNEVRVDGAALGWTLMIMLGTTVLFGLVPGMKLVVGKAAAANLQDALKDSGHGMSVGGRHERLRSAMVVAEIALSCVLLISAGLLLRSFVNAMRVDMGFDASHAAAMKIDYDQSSDGVKRAVVLQEILGGVLAIPGVKQAGVADMLPLGRNRSWQFWALEHLPQKGNIDVAMVRIVTPGYLAAMGMRLRTGRDFSWEDGQKAPKVVIVNQAAARHFWPGEDAMGKESVLDGGDEGHARVIGVLSDVRQTGLEDAAAPEIYVPVMQCPPEGAELVVRSDLPVGTLAGSVQSALRAVNPEEPAYALEPLEDIVDHSVSPRRFLLVLVGSFAGLGLVLASLGIYGVIAYSVTQRTQEIGIRMALGATAGQIQKSVMAKTLRLAGIGIAVGTVVSFAVARTMAALLFGTGFADPMTYLGMIGLLGLVAAVAGYVPARRASSIEPAIALRSE
jgi:predicted permease